jgi:DNA-binding response OmpR family regulator
MRVQVVEDEAQLAGQIVRALRRNDHVAESVLDGIAGLEASRSDGFDLVVLDVNLPGLDGFSVLREMRAAHVHTRVLMLTARGEVGDRVNGLKSGADDYLTKPFAMEELLARIDALGRRTPLANDTTILEVGDLRMDLVHRKLTRRGMPIPLSPREFEVLQIFMIEPGRTFSREEICERIWEREHEYDTRTVEIFIMRLRKKLDEGQPHSLIDTVRGVGYVLHPP